MTGAIDPNRAAEALRDAFRSRGADPKPRAYLVLGSGLSELAEELENAVEVPFSDLPGFPTPGVSGHRGRFLLGSLGTAEVLVQTGRLHLYEGHPPATVVLPVRTVAALGVPVAVFTNAAGGINRHLAPGDLMLIDDHINLMFRSPLAGPVVGTEDRFPDMSAPYDPGLQAIAERAATAERIPLVRGTYAAVLGPSFETPAEIRMLASWRADAVGMSTVPEVIAARAVGVRVLALSMITNRAAGLGAESLSHDEVLTVGKQAGASLARILRRVAAELESAGTVR